MGAVAVDISRMQTQATITLSVTFIFAPRQADESLNFKFPTDALLSHLGFEVSTNHAISDKPRCPRRAHPWLKNRCELSTVHPITGDDANALDFDACRKCKQHDVDR